MKRLSLIHCGILCAVVYLSTAIFYRNGPTVYSRTGRELFAWFCCISLLFLFWRGYKATKQAEQSQLRVIVLFACVLGLLAFFVFPFHSTDVFGYINRGWQQVHYGQNPYAIRLADVPNWQADPMLTQHWMYNPNPYGFLFSIEAYVICWLGNGNWWLTLGLFKTVNLATYAGVGYLLYINHKFSSLAQRNVALYLFLWHPLILMHQIANGHNGLLTGLLVALAMYLASQRRYFWIMPLLMAAALLKFAPVVLLPLAFIFVIKNSGRRTALLSALLSTAFAIAVSFPYLRHWQSLRIEDIFDNAILIDNSLHSFLIHIFENVARLFPTLAVFHSSVNTAIKVLLRGGFVVFLARCYVRVPAQFNAKQFARQSLLILFVLICVVSSKFNAWYLSLILPLALFLDDEDWLRRLIVLISGAELLSLTFFKQAYMLNYFAMVLIPAWIVFAQERKKRQKTATADMIVQATPAESSSYL